MYFRPPLRFVVIVLSLWTGFRWLAWTPLLTPSSDARPPLHLASAQPVASPPISIPGPIAGAMHGGSAGHARSRERPFFTPVSAKAPNTDRATRSIVTAHRGADPLLGPHNASPRSVLPVAAPHSGTRHARSLSIAIWAQWRTDVGLEPLANAGELGGSQAGVRISYPLVDVGAAQISLAARLSSPIERLDGAEAAIGLAMQPIESVPLSLMLDRRIAVTREGRNAWSVGVAGGVYRKPVAIGLELDGYAQAGMVGANSRDLFVDGSATVSRPVPIGNRLNLSLGAGIWGGAQPGASRVDIGPEIGLRFSTGDMGIRMAVGWRQRIAGSAEPGSGPTLSLGADF